MGGVGVGDCQNDSIVGWFDVSDIFVSALKYRGLLLSKLFFSVFVYASMAIFPPIHPPLMMFDFRLSFVYFHLFNIITHAPGSIDA